MHLPLVIENLMHTIARKEGLTNYKFELDSGSKCGDNYYGVLTSIKLIGDREINGVVTCETLSLICKMAPKSKERREALNVIPSFIREIKMYTRVLPTFAKFQEEKGLLCAESFLSFPKLYAWTAGEEDDTYALIMEDLRTKNFVMWPRIEPMPLDHEESVFQQLGRFHGVSLALKDQRPEVFAEFKSLNDIFSGSIEAGNVGKRQILDETLKRAINVLEEEEHKNVIGRLRSSYLETLRSFYTKEAVEKFGVICHGDCWTNNLLFLYTENTKEVKDTCFIDFQFSRYASPVLDILYHTFSSTRKPLRDNSYDDLLKIYFNSLSDTVRRLGSDPEKLISFLDLQTELKAYGKYALIKGLLLLPVVFAQPGEFADLEEYTESLLKGDNISLFTTDGSGNDAYVKAVNEMVSDVISYGYDH